MAGRKFAEPSSVIDPDLQLNEGTTGLVGIGTGVGLGVGCTAVVVVTVGVADAGVAVPLLLLPGVVAAVAVTPMPDVGVVAVWLEAGPVDGPGKRNEEKSAPASPNKSRITTSTGSSFFCHALPESFFLGGSGAGNGAGFGGMGGTSGSTSLLRSKSAADNGIGCAFPIGDHSTGSVDQNRCVPASSSSCKKCFPPDSSGEEPALPVFAAGDICCSGTSINGGASNCSDGPGVTTGGGVTATFDGGVRVCASPVE